MDKTSSYTYLSTSPITRDLFYCRLHCQQAAFSSPITPIVPILAYPSPLLSFFFNYIVNNSSILSLCLILSTLLIFRLDYEQTRLSFFSNYAYQSKHFYICLPSSLIT